MNTVTIDELGPRQIDALREVGTIGSGAAATALSAMLKRRIMIRVPDLAVLPRAQAVHRLGADDEPAAVISMHVLGDVNGETLFVLPATTARDLIARLVEQEVPRFPEDLDDLGRSTLVEVGNILAGAYLNTLSDFLGLMMIMSVPALSIRQGGTILKRKIEPADLDLVLHVQTVFEIDDRREPLQGSMVVLPTAPSLRAILRALRLG